MEWNKNFSIEYDVYHQTYGKSVINARKIMNFKMPRGGGRGQEIWFLKIFCISFSHLDIKTQLIKCLTFKVFLIS